jgi:hypothetical protein
MICGFVVQLETEAVDRECDYKVRKREREREREGEREREREILWGEDFSAEGTRCTGEHTCPRGWMRACVCVWYVALL